jgi:DNA repair protein RadA/Sms
MHGVDSGRLAMVLAVLERRCGVKLYDRDVYVSTVGGAKVMDPSADLAAAMAIASAAGNATLPARFVALGEVGLAGELRRVPGTDRRLAEAGRLGFTEAVVPAESSSARDRMPSMRHGIRVHSAPTLQLALDAVGILPRRGGGRESSTGVG